MGTQLTLVFHIQEADSGFTATFDSPDQGALGIPFTSVEFNDDTLLLSAANIGAFYEGVPAADSIAGIWRDRKSTRLNSSHVAISYAVFCLKKKSNWDLINEIRIPTKYEVSRQLC